MVTNSESEKGYDLTLIDLFRVELDNHTKVLETGLVEIETEQSSEKIEPLMRAAHSIKGAARIVGLDAAVSLAHTMEDILTNAQKNKLKLLPEHIDLLLKSNDIYMMLKDFEPAEIPEQIDFFKDIMNSLESGLMNILEGKSEQSRQHIKKDAIHQFGTEFKENGNELADISMLELFKTELENHTKTIESGIIGFKSEYKTENIETLIQAAHSIRASAGIIGLDKAITLAQSMEKVLSSVKTGRILLQTEQYDLLLKGNDIYKSLIILNAGEIPRQLDNLSDIINTMSEVFDSLLTSAPVPVKEVIPDKSDKEDFITDYEIISKPPTENAIKTDYIVHSQQQTTQKTSTMPAEYADATLLELFKIEVENHTKILETGLVEIESEQTSTNIEPLMRAAHSIKGAARIVGMNLAVNLAHAMEDILSAAQADKLKLTSEHIDILLQGNDVYKYIISGDEQSIPSLLEGQVENIDYLSKILRDILLGKHIDYRKKEIEPKQHEINIVPVEYAPEKENSFAIVAANVRHITPKPKETALDKPLETKLKKDTTPKDVEKVDESFVRVLSENLNKLMGLAGESLVQAKAVKPYSVSLLKIKKALRELNSLRENITLTLKEDFPTNEIIEKFELTNQLYDQIRDYINSHIESFELFSRRLEFLTERLYNEAIATRMKPFSEGLHGFPRMVRDLTKNLGKRVNFQIEGSNTRIDRDILEKLESPLTHLIRNAIDHGLETPEERIATGKPPEGKLVLEARHRSGMLIISIKDDGRGIDHEQLRRKVVEKGFASEDMAVNLTVSELMDFLFLPGFSTASTVTEISGRGVGLDVVFSMVNEVGGTVRAESQLNIGTTFLLQLPLTLSVLRTLLIDISDEPYALPLSRIDRILEITEDDLQLLEDRQYCIFDNENIGIIDAYQVLKLKNNKKSSTHYHLVIISDRLNRYGLAVDNFLGERDLVVIPIDRRLGKIPNIAAGAILEDGSPVLILDADDLVRSIDNILTQEKLHKLKGDDLRLAAKKKRILVVDDSLTVREVERKLLENRGYSVTVAVDGMDGWNVLHREQLDLVISDVDMPRMNGIELVTKIKQDSRLKDLPVMIVSYKDREEDKMLGLEAGANYYLTKSSFHDETLVNAVRDLIGEAT